MRARTVMGLALAAIVLTAVARLQRRRLLEQRRDDRRHDHGGCVVERRAPDRDRQLHRLAEPVQLHRVAGLHAMMMIYPQLVQYGAGIEVRG